ncbi:MULTISPECIES: hypothetical protein, partial [Acinetobacter]|uniref:hypothetical protein n=1 Tax=Acinetobacter TaxID=469 RepID=UPI001C080B70
GIFLYIRGSAGMSPLRATRRQDNRPYPSYALNLDQLGALCISNLCATKPQKTEGTSIESN